MCFKKEASTLVCQVSESLLTLDGSRVQQEKLVADQQRQVNELLRQTQKVIAQCQETTTEMKQQQWALNAQFVGMQKWRGDVEQEILKDRGSQQVFSEKVVTSHVESQAHLDKVKKELCEMKEYNRNRTGNVHGVSTQMTDGAQIESRSDWPGNTGAPNWPGNTGAPNWPEKPGAHGKFRKHKILNQKRDNRTPPPEKNTLPPEKNTPPRSKRKLRDFTRECD